MMRQVMRPVVLGFAIALAMLAPTLVTAQDTGYLVVVPGLPEVGDTVDVVALNLMHGVTYGIDWTYHFAREGEPCGDTGGTIHGDQQGHTYVTLVACHAGNAPLALYVVDTGEVVDEVVALIASRPKVSLSFAGEPRVRPRTPTAVVATFSEPVEGFDLDDVVVTNGTASSLSESTDTTYTFSVSPNSVEDVSLYVRPYRVRSAASGLRNTASNTLVLTPYDDNSNGSVDRDEVLNAIEEYLIGDITYDEVITIIEEYLSGE